MNKKFRGMVYSTFHNAASMAREMGWEKQKLHRIMTGKQEPSVSELHELAAALHTPVIAVVNAFAPQNVLYP